MRVDEVGEVVDFVVDYGVEVFFGVVLVRVLVGVFLFNGGVWLVDGVGGDTFATSSRVN